MKMISSAKLVALIRFDSNDLELKSGRILRSSDNLVTT